MINKRRIILYIISFILVFLFAAVEVIVPICVKDKIPSIMPYFQMLKTITYIVFISIYMFYMKSKLNDKRIIRGVMLVLILLIAWNIFKILKWDYSRNDFIEQLFWYLFYIPTLFLFGFLLFYENILLSTNKVK